jgi:hypothetical protein
MTDEEFEREAWDGMVAIFGAGVAAGVASVLTVLGLWGLFAEHPRGFHLAIASALAWSALAWYARRRALRLESIIAAEDT